MMTAERLNTVLSRTTYPGFRFVVRGEYGRNDQGRYLQVECVEGKCTVTGEPLEWRGRKWPISSHMTDSEVVQTCFLAVMTAMEHEARESFRYRGVTIFAPHFNVEKLVGFASADVLDIREEPE